MALVMVRPRSAPRAGIRLVLLAALFGGCSFLVPTSPPATVVEGAWKRGADAPVALTEVAVAAHDDRIWVAGGLTGEGAGSTDVLVYDPEADTWTDGPDLPVPVHHSSLVSDGASLWLVGGYAGNGFDGESPGGTNAQVECIDEDGDIAVLPDLAHPRHGLGAAVVDGVAYVLLGGDQPGLFVSPTVESLEVP